MTETDLGPRLKKIRAKYKLSQTVFAMRAGVTQVIVSQIERGARGVRRDYEERVAAHVREMENGNETEFADRDSYRERVRHIIGELKRQYDNIWGLGDYPETAAACKCCQRAIELLETWRRPVGK